MTPRIRIAFVIDLIRSPTAGTEKQLCNIVEHLDRSRFDPCLCLLQETGWSRDQFRGERYVAGIGSLLRPEAPGRLVRFARFLRNGRFQLVHTFHRDGEIVGALAGRLAGVPRIIGSRRDQGYWLNARERAIRSGLRRLHHGYVTNAHSTREWLIREESIPGAMIEVIPNGIDLARFTAAADRGTARLELGLKEDDAALVCVATLRPVKRHADLLQGFAAAAREGGRWKLVLIGDGECRPDLERQAAVLGIADRVLFLGTRLDVPRLLSGMDAGVLVSESESMSNTLLEYLAAGLPVISTDVGEARYLVTGNESGHLVPVGDADALAAAIAGLGDPERRAAMRPACLAASRPYAIEGCMRSFAEYYEGCLE